eukprot:GHVS01097518.1.p1 GENE.GHVS01097518.1~~GHVS01097518.1.p1  ORF type:complete len:625 (-),score=199.54 GHVS01097518.1:2311-4044(-)
MPRADVGNTATAGGTLRNTSDQCSSLHHPVVGDVCSFPAMVCRRHENIRRALCSPSSSSRWCRSALRLPPPTLRCSPPPPTILRYADNATTSRTTGSSTTASTSGSSSTASTNGSSTASGSSSDGSRCGTNGGGVGCHIDVCVSSGVGNDSSLTCSLVVSCPSVATVEDLSVFLSSSFPSYPPVCLQRLFHKKRLLQPTDKLSDLMPTANSNTNILNHNVQTNISQHAKSSSSNSLSLPSPSLAPSDSSASSSSFFISKNQQLSPSTAALPQLTLDIPPPLLSSPPPPSYPISLTQLSLRFASLLQLTDMLNSCHQQELNTTATTTAGTQLNHVLESSKQKLGDGRCGDVVTIREAIEKRAEDIMSLWTTTAAENSSATTQLTPPTCSPSRIYRSACGFYHLAVLPHSTQKHTSALPAASVVVVPPLLLSASSELAERLKLFITLHYDISMISVVCRCLLCLVVIHPSILPHASLVAVVTQLRFFRVVGKFLFHLMVPQTKLWEPLAALLAAPQHQMLTTPDCDYNNTTIPPTPRIPTTTPTTPTPITPTTPAQHKQNQHNSNPKTTQTTPTQNITT